MVEHGKRDGRERVERRKIVQQVRCDQLKELRGGRDVFQTMPAQCAKRRSRKGFLARDVSHCARHDHLPSVSRRADPRGDDDIRPEVTLFSELGLTRMDPDSKPVRRLVGPRLRCERTLHLGCGSDRVTRPRERKKDPVARPVDLGSVVDTRCLADELAHACTRRPEALPELIQKTRRAFDIGEEQGHRPRRQRARRAVLDVHESSLGGRMARRTLSGRVRHAVRQAPGDARRARP